MRLAMIVTALPPEQDGVGDYTACLSEALVQERLAERITLYTDRRRRFDDVPGVEVEGVFDPSTPKTNWDILKVAGRDHPDWVILQYSPFAYGNRGFNLQLPRVMNQIRQQVSGTKVAVMFHEKFVTGPRWQVAVMTTWQRWQFYQLGKAADAVFFSVGLWAERYKRSFGEKPVVHLPVGSAVKRIAISHAEARSRLGIQSDETVLGIFGTAHASRRFEMIVEAANEMRRRGMAVRVLYIGADGVRVRAALGDLPAITDGPLPVDEVSRRLAAIDIYIATYSDGISTRRSAMMAALEHALPIVGTFGQSTDPELMNQPGLILKATDDVKGFTDAILELAANPQYRNELGRHAETLFQQKYSWHTIAKKLTSVLRDGNVAEKVA